MTPLKWNTLKEGCLYLLFTGIILAFIVAITFALLWFITFLARLAGLPGWVGLVVLAALYVWALLTRRED